MHISVFNFFVAKQTQIAGLSNHIKITGLSNGPSDKNCFNVSCRHNLDDSIFRLKSVNTKRIG